MGKDIVRKVQTTVSRFQMLAPGDSVVVAVSGGADSVCLLHVLHSLRDILNMTLTVAHFDHGLRPDADESETQFVADLATSLHVDIVVEKAGSLLSPGSPSLEEKARELRYRFLAKVREACGAQKIATGHTLNDQAETVLMRLLRGSGPAGLSGIQPVGRNGIVRPLIDLTRREILAYLGERKIQYVTDASNLDPAYLRNSIRLDLLPQIEAYQPRIAEILSRTADIARADNQWMETQARTWIAAQGQTGPAHEATFPVSGFNELPEALKNHVIRGAIERTAGSLRRIGLSHIEAIKGLTAGTRPQARVTLPGGLLVRRIYGSLIFSKGDLPLTDRCSFRIERTGVFFIDALGCTVTVEETETGLSSEDLKSGPWTAFLDADRIDFPLMLRRFRPGDRFVPLGMKGHRKVKDFFIDMKIPSDIRARIPLLVHENRVIWVCGLRMDDRFKVTPDTRRVWKVTLSGALSPLPDHLLKTQQQYLKSG